MNKFDEITELDCKLIDNTKTAFNDFNDLNELKELKELNIDSIDSYSVDENDQDDEDEEDESYEYQNVFKDPKVQQVRNELNLKIKSFEEDLKQLEFVLAMIKERRKKFQDIIFNQNDQDIIQNCCKETKEKLEAAKKRLSDFENLMETKVKELDFAINQRWVDLQYIEKSTEGLFDRIPKLKDHFYDSQEQLEKEADGILVALDQYTQHLKQTKQTKIPTLNVIENTNEYIHQPTSQRKLSQQRNKFSPAKMNHILVGLN